MRCSVVGTVVIGLGCATSGAGWAQQIEAGSVQLQFTGRAHVQFSTSSVGDEEADGTVASTAFETRRARLGVILTVDEWITAMIEPEFASGEVELRNAWMNLGFSESLEFRIGHFKKPFSRLTLTSSTMVPTIERGLRIRGLEDALALADAAESEPVLTAFLGAPLIGEEQALLNTLGYDGYDLGAMAHGRLGPIGYEAGVFNGVGADAPDANDAKSYAARAVWSREGETPLEIGAGVSHRELGEPELDGTAYEIDAEWGEFRRSGLHVIAELTSGSIIATDATFSAAHAIISVFRALGGDRLEGIEFVGRGSWGDPSDEVEEDAGLLLTPGINVYLFGRNMLMLNWDVYVPEGDRFETQHSLKAQARFHF